MESWDEYIGAVVSGLRDLKVTDGTGAPLAAAEAFQRWNDLTCQVHAAGSHVFLIGNGASAAMASHMAADACKNAGLRAMAFTDAALLTATSNDVAFDEVFALPLSRLARAGDLLISIGSSGQSPNVVRALEAARGLDLHIVTLSGKAAGNSSRRFGSLNFYVPLQRYGWVECSHQVVLHHWLDQYLNVHGQGAI